MPPRHLAFAAGFAATCAVIVPLAWHRLDASIEKDGKKLRPLQEELELNGTRVTLDVDRGLAMVGSDVTATLRAYSDVPGKIPLDVRVYYTTDEWGGRVSPPPKQIDVEHITLDSRPDGGKPVQTRIKLAGSGKINTYRIFVAPHGAEVDSEAEGTGDTIAAATVMAWAGNDFGMSIKPQGKIVTGQPFTVAVRIKNTSNHSFDHVPYVHLASKLGLYGLTDAEDVAVTPADDDDETPSRHADGKFRPGQTLVERFKVTPANADLKEVTLVASAYLWDEEPGPVAAGAMDATTIQLPKANAKVASK